MALNKVLPPLPATRDLLRIYELRALKDLSQNFLLDMNICRKIVHYAGSLEDATVCEIGPGPGSITRAIMEQNVRRLDLVEKDSRFMPTLELLQSATKSTFNIHHGDVLKFDFENLYVDDPLCPRKSWHDSPPKIFLIGNLPFNVATPLIIRLLKQMALRKGPFSHGRCPLTLTFQKEVAERMVAPIMNRQRCRLSVMSQVFADVKHLFTIPGQAFLPKPEVDVGVVKFVPLEKMYIPLHPDLVEKFCRHFFHYRQKYCQRCVETLFPPDLQKIFARELLRRARVNPKSKCTLISNEEIRDMCLIYYEMCLEKPGLFYYDYRASKSKDQTLENFPQKFPPEFPFKNEMRESL